MELNCKNKHLKILTWTTVCSLNGKSSFCIIGFDYDKYLSYELES